MEVKMGICSPYYLLMIVGLWATFCYAVPSNGASSKGKRTIPNALLSSSDSTGNVHGKLTSTTTTDSLINLQGSRSSSTATSNTTPQRNKRDTSDTQAHFGMFPADIRNADDALQKLLLLLTLTKPKVEDYEEDFDNPPIDLVLGKEPGRSVRGLRPQSVKVEEPTGLPIVLYQHRMNKKSYPASAKGGIHELFLKDAATSSGYELDRRIIKLLDRMFNRQSRAKIIG